MYLVSKYDKITFLIIFFKEKCKFMHGMITKFFFLMYDVHEKNYQKSYFVQEVWYLRKLANDTIRKLLRWRTGETLMQTLKWCARPIFSLAQDTCRSTQLNFVASNDMKKSCLLPMSHCGRLWMHIWRH